MATRIGINGFGRIGRLSFRTITERYPQDIEIVAINDLTNAQTNAFLLQQDSNYGRFKGSVDATVDGIIVNGKKINIYSECEPGAIPWDNDGVDIVLEASGVFTDAHQAAAHLERGVKRVVIGAPAKHEDITLVLSGETSRSSRTRAAPRTAWLQSPKSCMTISASKRGS